MNKVKTGLIKFESLIVGFLPRVFKLKILILECNNIYIRCWKRDKQLVKCKNTTRIFNILKVIDHSY